MNELNKKLAEWAGFYLSDAKVVYRYMQDKREPCWLNPNGTVAYGGMGRGTYPDFLNDLNACFKWLVPKLDRWVIRNYVPCVGTYPMPRAKVSYQGGDPKRYAGWLHGEAEAETPALALCKAIEQLMEKP